MCEHIQAQVCTRRPPPSPRAQRKFTTELSESSSCGSDSSELFLNTRQVCTVNNISIQSLTRDKKKFDCVLENLIVSFAVERASARRQRPGERMQRVRRENGDEGSRQEGLHQQQHRDLRAEHPGYPQGRQVELREHRLLREEVHHHHVGQFHSVIFLEIPPTRRP